MKDSVDFFSYTVQPGSFHTQPAIVFSHPDKKFIMNSDRLNPKHIKSHKICILNSKSLFLNILDSKRDIGTSVVPPYLCSDEVRFPGYTCTGISF